MSIWLFARAADSTPQACRGVKHSSPVLSMKLIRSVSPLANGGQRESGPGTLKGRAMGSLAK